MGPLLVIDECAKFYLLIHIQKSGQLIVGRAREWAGAGGAISIQMHRGKHVL